MSGSHYAAEPPGLPRSDERTRYDLRTAMEHEQDDVTRLAMQVDRLADALEHETAARTALEREVATLRQTVAGLDELVQRLRAAGVEGFA